MTDSPRLQVAPASAALVAVGVSHRTAPVAFRERLALLGAAAAELLAEAMDHASITEAVVVATCNRTELYLTAADPATGERAALAVLARRAGVTLAVLRRHGYVLRGAEAAGHLFAVAAGLDSAVVGESQILGQVRRARELALELETAGTVTARLFADAVSAGRRVRARTGVGRAGVSVSSAAVEIAREQLGELGAARVLVVGTGRSGELTAEALAGRGAAVVVLANRCERRAQALADRYGIAIGLDALADELSQADVVISATSSPHHLISREQVAAAMGRRRGRPLLLIDIALPRDIDPAAGDVAGVSLVDLDELERRVAGNLDRRLAWVGPAGAIVRDEAARFEHWRAGLAATPTICALRLQADAIVARVLEQNAGRWEGLSPADRERVELVARTVAQRLLHAPTTRLRRAAQEDDDDAVLDAARALFGLGETAAFDAAAAAAAAL